MNCLVSSFSCCSRDLCNYIQSCWTSFFTFFSIFFSCLLDPAVILYYIGIAGDFYGFTQIYKGGQDHFNLYGFLLLSRVLQNAFVLWRKSFSVEGCLGLGLTHFARLYIETKKCTEIKEKVLYGFEEFQYFVHTHLEICFLVLWSFKSFHGFDYTIISMIFFNMFTTSYFFSKYYAFSREQLQELPFSSELLKLLLPLIFEHLISTIWVPLAWSLLILVAEISHLVLFVALILVAGFALSFNPNLIPKADCNGKHLIFLFMNIFGVSLIPQKNLLNLHRFILLLGMVFVFGYNIKNLSENLESHPLYFGLMLFLAGVIVCFLVRRYSHNEEYFLKQREKLQNWYNARQPAQDAPFVKASKNVISDQGTDSAGQVYYKLEER